MEYDEEYIRSIEHPESFWSERAAKLHWDKHWITTMDTTSQPPHTRWFVGGELNLCYNCIDRHIEQGFGEETPYIFHSPVTDTVDKVSFNRLLHMVSHLAGVLASWGVQRGDVVVVYMPLTLEGVVSFLACARLGAIHNVVPGGLPAEDLALRVEHSQPKVLLVGSHGYHPQGWVDYKAEVDNALRLTSHQPENILVHQRKGLKSVNMIPGRDHDWDDEMKQAKPHPCVPIPSTDLLFILYSSGSTGIPKAVGLSVGSCAVRLSCGFPMDPINKPDLTIFATTSLGWIAGHILVYSTLLLRMKSVFLEGDHKLMESPDMLYGLLQQYNVNVLLARPGILRATKGMDPNLCKSKNYDFSRLEIVLVTGEPVDIPTLEWSYKAFGAPFQNCYGQTETCGPVTGAIDMKDLDIKKYNIPGKPTLGFNVQCIRDGVPTKPSEIGRLLIKSPYPPGMLTTLYRNEDLCIKTYFDPYPGYFDTKDEGYVTADGSFKMEHRADDVIKAGPIYVGATAIEEAIMENPDIAECLVAAMPHNKHRETPVAFVVKSSRCKTADQDLIQQLISKVKEHFGRSMPFEDCVLVQDLPRTRTGKTHRPSAVSLLKGLPDSEMKSGAVENPDVIQHLRTVLKSAGVVSDIEKAGV